MYQLITDSITGYEWYYLYIIYEETDMKKTILLIIFILSLFTISYSKSSDPLPSWNDTAVKKNIISYIENITNTKSPDYIPEQDRIAVFDNDGTLWTEEPIIQLLFSFYKVNKMAETDKSLAATQPFKAILNNDKKYLENMDENDLVKLVLKTQTGTDTIEFEKEVADFIYGTTYPKLNIPIYKTVYQPQIELINYLKENKFKVYICSGGDINFMRAVSQKLYGISPENIIGSYPKYSYNTEESKVIRGAEVVSNNDKAEKPANIELFIGKKPVIAVGNIGGGGDIYMLHYSQNGQNVNPESKNYKTLQILINHDDEKREFKYAEKDNISLNWAQKYKWNVVSMKNDWKQIFPR